MPSLFWFRRDLRLQDNPRSISALKAQRLKILRWVCCYPLDLDTFGALSAARQHSLVESLKALGASMQGALTVRHGRGINAVAEQLTQFCKSQAIKQVFATEAFDPMGIVEQRVVAEMLQSIGVKLTLRDSYYAVAPGSVAKPDGTNYRVYTPFQKAWMERGWQKPYKLPSVDRFAWFYVPNESHGTPVPTAPAPFEIKAGEAFALRTWERFKKRALYNYDEVRNRADLSGTSHLSHALAFGEIHPRTLLAELADVSGHNVYRKELAWREFYADVLWHNPHTLDHYYDPKYLRMRYDTGALADERLQAWREGKTGYPIVDAGMRQLARDGWMHNRVRMIVASFLVKDLHLEWMVGADWFEQNLTDFDPASNSHGWQWTAGCGTDASPYYRIFNPTLQGLKFDPDGNYVRKYIPELAHIDGVAVHEPWLLIDGGLYGYPSPIVDHSTERNEALARLEELKNV